MIRVPFVATFGFVSEFGDCVYELIYPQVTIAIVVADFFLAVGMFLIFVQPLLQHSEQMKQLGEASITARSTLNRMIRRNLIFSVISLTGTFVSLTTLCVLMWIAILNGTHKTDFLRFWALFGVSFESMINVVCIHGMTTAWQPSFLKKALGTQGTTYSSANDKGESGKTKKIVVSLEATAQSDTNE